ncbi:MAG: metal ABC transporter ATP-binding protein [Chitinivibrionales bacterium]
MTKHKLDSYDRDEVVVFKDVCFAYADREVLHNISFAVKKNSFVGVVGPNGGGKTTLLRLMLGLITPGRGAITVMGNRPQKVRGRIGYVMQHMDYDSRFPARVVDIVLMGRIGHRPVGPFGRDDQLKAAHALEQVGLGGFEKRTFSELSGGQQQRVLIAQALSSEPELLLLDEPTANIDIEGERAIHSMLTSLKKHMTIISVSHNVNTVLKAVTHVLCVNNTAVLNPIEELHPDTIAQTYGNEIAVLHHEFSCHVYDASRAHKMPHKDDSEESEK